MASAGPRYFGFVIGGRLPVALAADWLTSTWDQNGCLYAMSPAVAELEEIAGGWVKQLLGPSGRRGRGLRHRLAGGEHHRAARRRASHLLQRAGWNLEVDGVRGSPPLHVVVGEEAHSSILRALRFLGVGTRDVHALPTDAQGRLRADGLAAAARAARGPHAGVRPGGQREHRRLQSAGADGGRLRAPRRLAARGRGLRAVGRGRPRARRHLVRGVERAQSWATDAHKWLNVPYDSAMVAVRPAQALRDAVSVRAAYLTTAEGERNALEYGPEMSRRARGVTVYAALRSLGREGVAAAGGALLRARRALRRAARGRARRAGAHEVVLNQALVRFQPAGLDGLGRRTRSPAPSSPACRRRAPAGSGGTVWQGRPPCA